MCTWPVFILITLATRKKVQIFAHFEALEWDNTSIHRCYPFPCVSQHSWRPRNALELFFRSRKECAHSPFSFLVTLARRKKCKFLPIWGPYNEITPQSTDVIPFRASPSKVEGPGMLWSSPLDPGRNVHMARFHFNNPSEQKKSANFCPFRSPRMR
jgi:hypothetical protein